MKQAVLTSVFFTLPRIDIGAVALINALFECDNRVIDYIVIGWQTIDYLTTLYNLLANLLAVTAL
ncbi:hypothetical protein RIVM261_059450 [Rivularia sp. IAM M-261]|nr:hypothetical protein RIVM261_059450 [Rivularia sp. IAM M-261]